MSSTIRLMYRVLFIVATIVCGPFNYVRSPISVNHGHVSSLETNSNSLPKLELLEATSRAELMVERIAKDRLRTRFTTNSVLEDILQWLWDVAVEPVHHLGFDGTPQYENWPHV